MVDAKEVISKISKYKGGKPLASYKLTTQSDSAQLEPIYYWILDFLQDARVDVKKITDNFMASPGSGQFQDMTQRQATFMTKAGEYLGAINQVTKSILNLIYDLKEFEIRLEQYKRSKDPDKAKKAEGMLALKQVWLDNVDLKKGNGSIHQMANQMGFTTLREAFMIANSPDDIRDMASKDGGNVINDSVMRILLPRISEFLIWVDISEKELFKRFSIEKSYLRSQVETLKMYAKWARPYLKALDELKMKGFEKDPALVAAFSTSMFELSLLGKSKVAIEKNPDLKKKFPDYKLKRDYFAVYVVNMEYRGHLGQVAGQGKQSGYGFGFGGRIDMNFDCYALNAEELKLIEAELDKTDVSDALKFLEDSTGDTLKSLEEDIQHFVFDDKKKEEEKKKEVKKEDDTNPFTAIFSGIGSLFSGNFSWNEKKKEVKEPKDIQKDNFVEEAVRAQTEKSAKDFMYAVYDIYKKAHGMASSPEKFDS